MADSLLNLIPTVIGAGILLNLTENLMEPEWKKSNMNQWGPVIGAVVGVSLLSSFSKLNKVV